MSLFDTVQHFCYSIPQKSLLQCVEIYKGVPPSCTFMNRLTCGIITIIAMDQNKTNPTYRLGLLKITTVAYVFEMNFARNSLCMYLVNSTKLYICCIIYYWMYKKETWKCWVAKEALNFVNCLHIFCLNVNERFCAERLEKTESICDLNFKHYSFLTIESWFF